MSDPFIGQLALVPYTFAPKGWALCNGQLLPINQNQALFSLLGTNFGGDGRITFALPDLRGRVPISSGQGPNLENYNLGQAGGTERVTLSAAQIPGSVYTNKAANAAAADSIVGSAGSTQPHENRPPYLTLNWIIALQGLYPVRS